MARVEGMTAKFNPSATVNVNAQGIQVIYGDNTHHYPHAAIRAFNANLLSGSKAEVTLKLKTG